MFLGFIKLIIKGKHHSVHACMCVHMCVQVCMHAHALLQKSENHIPVRHGLSFTLDLNWQPASPSDSV